MQLSKEPKVIVPLQESKAYTPEVKAAVEQVKDENKGFITGQLLPATAEFGADFGVGLERALTPISTRIKNISGDVYKRLRKFEFDVKKNTIADHEAIVPFLRKLKTLDEDSKIALDLALKNGDKKVIKAIGIANNMTNELNAVKSVLDNLHDRTIDAGMKVNYRWDFFPRIVDDVDGLMDHLAGETYWSAIEEALSNKSATLERDLTKDEKIGVINNLLMGRPVDGVSLAKKGVFKERSIEQINLELNKFYGTSDKALLNYVGVANEAIETSIFFGKAVDLEGNPDVTDSVGALVAELKLGSREATLLAEMLAARFNSGRMGRIAAAARNLSYMDTMGTVLNAATQIGDIATSLFNSGILNTLSVLPAAVMNKTRMALKDIAVDQIAEEFDSGSLTSLGVNKVFKLSGLHKMDAVGKLTLVNSALKKYTQQAKKNNASLNKELEFMFEGDAAQVKQDLMDGNITNDVKFLLFNKLLDMQPMAKSEMPEY